jgi:hypothetical protein
MTCSQLLAAVPSYVPSLFPVLSSLFSRLYPVFPVYSTRARVRELVSVIGTLHPFTHSLYRETTGNNWELGTSRTGVADRTLKNKGGS